MSITASQVAADQARAIAIAHRRKAEFAQDFPGMAAAPAMNRRVPVVLRAGESVNLTELARR